MTRSCRLRASRYGAQGSLRVYPNEPAVMSPQYCRPASAADTVQIVAHISVPEGVPGIRSLFAFRPDVAVPMSALADVLLHAPSSLSRGERELIAAYVSAQN